MTTLLLNYDPMDSYQRFIDSQFLEDIEEELTEEPCPVCGYPIVLEEGLEVCYCCGWFKEDKETGGATNGFII